MFDFILRSGVYESILFLMSSGYFTCCRLPAYERARPYCCAARSRGWRCEHACTLITGHDPDVNNATNNPETVNLTQGDDGGVPRDPYEVRLPHDVVFRLQIRRNTRQSSGVMVSPTSSPAEYLARNSQQRLPTASGVPVDCGPAVEQASAYWRDLGRQVLQY